MSRLRLAYFIFSALVVVFVNSFGKVGKSDEVKSPTIEGQIENWPQGYVLYAHVGGYITRDGGYFPYGTVRVGSKGNFTYTLPIPRKGHLYPITFKTSCKVSSEPTVSPQNCKSAYFVLTAVKGPQSGDVRLLESQPDIGQIPPVKVEGFYIYVNQDTTINGSLKREYCDGNFTSEWIFDNVKLTRGWNYVELIFVSYDQNANIVTYRFERKLSPSPNLRWMFTRP